MEKFKNVVHIDSHGLIAEGEGSTIQAYDNNGLPVFVAAPTGGGVPGWDAGGNLITIDISNIFTMAIATHTNPALTAAGGEYKWTITTTKTAGAPVFVQIMDNATGNIVYPDVTVKADSTIDVVFSEALVGAGGVTAATYKAFVV